MLFKFQKIVGCIEPWVKNRDTNRIVSLCIVTALKINVSKTQILSFNYTPPKEIMEIYDLKWNLKSIQYLGVTITKNSTDLYKANYNNLDQEVKKDIARWSTLPLDLNSRIEIVKLNILPRFLYLFQICLGGQKT